MSTKEGRYYLRIKANLAIQSILCFIGPKQLVGKKWQYNRFVKDKGVTMQVKSKIWDKLFDKLGQKRRLVKDRKVGYKIVFE